jgi:hypothetical protein
MPRFIFIFLFFFINYQAYTKRKMGLETHRKIRITTTRIITSLIKELAASGNSF